MSDLGIDYNAEDHKPLESRDPVPPDHYEAQIVESTVEPTKRGDGKVMKLIWQITRGEYENRKVFDRVNMENPSEKAVEIGRRQLSSICRSVGKLKISNSEELHDVPVVIDVRIKPADGQYPASNEIRGYFPVEGYAPAEPQQSAPAPQPQPRQAPAPRQAPTPARQPVTSGAGVGKPPWARNK